MANKKQTAKRNAKRRNEILSKIVPSENVNIMSYDSQEWNDLVSGPDGSTWTKARGIVQALVKGGNREKPLRTTAFTELDPEQCRTLFRSLVTDEDMIPIEDKFLGKFGDFTPVDYDKWAHKVHSLWKTTTWNPNYTTLFHSVNEVVNEIRQANLDLTGELTVKPLPLEEGYEKVQKGKNSGWPYFTKHWAKDPEISEYYKSRAKLLIAGMDTLRGMPHMLFKRVQANGLDNDPKMRAVECPPKHEAIAAKCFTDKLVNIFKTMPTFYGFNGGENVYECLERFMRRDYLIEGDFSSFDQNCQEMMEVVFTALMQIVDKQYHPYLTNLLAYYQNAILITPEGILTGRKINGLNSGEGWTSVIGTLANAIAVKYAMRRMGIKEYDNLAFGDDIAIATDSEFNPDLFESAMMELGMECNKEKQGVTNGEDAYFSFLGYYHFKKSWALGNKGKFPIMRLASGLVFKERYEDLGGEYIEGEEYSSEQVRLLGYAMKLNVCKEHGDFEILVKTVATHEPTGLPVEKILSAKSLAQYLRVHRTSNRNSIENSPVIRVLGDMQGYCPIISNHSDVAAPTVALEPTKSEVDLYTLLIEGAKYLTETKIEGIHTCPEPIISTPVKDSTLSIEEVMETIVPVGLNPANELKRQGYSISTRIEKYHTSTLETGKKLFTYVWTFTASKGDLVRGEVKVLLNDKKAPTNSSIVRGAYQLLLTKVAMELT